MPFQKGHKMNIGRKCSDETRCKIRSSNKGKKHPLHTKEWKKIMSDRIKGSKNPFYGKTHTQESKRKNREAHLGEKSSMWKGGVSVGYLKQFATRPKPSKCEVCKDGGRIVFEHDHKTKKFRGWLCTRCNWILGMAKDSGELMSMLKSYLDKTR